MSSESRFTNCRSTVLVLCMSVCLAECVCAATAQRTRPWVRQEISPLEVVADTPAWERFADGSVGCISEFRGANNTPIAAFIRKPKGDGPFPVVVMIHGGGESKQGTYHLGRMNAAPTAGFIAEGWAVYSIDFRPKSSFDPIEWEDTCKAVESVKKLPFIDSRRVAMMGGSHGAHVSARVASRCDLSCAVLCAPAAIDLVEVAKARKDGFKLNTRLDQLIARMEEDYGAAVDKIIENPAAFEHASALTEVEDVRCPILLISGRDDSSSPPSVMETYAKKLKEAGKEVEVYLPNSGPHGFYFGRPRIPETGEAARRAVAFIRKHFGVPPKDSPNADYLRQKADRPSPQPAQRVLGVFRRLDANGDGTVAGDEAATGPGQRFLGLFDENGDGMVTLEEATGASAAARSRPSQPPKPLQDQGRQPRWVDPNKTEPAGTKYERFHSKTINGQVSYLIYLPPGYNKEETRRYPVLYWLHGGGGSQRVGSYFVELADRAVRAGNTPPMIIVLVNGLPSSLFNDSSDGQRPVESVIIKDLIPHIDATCRTIADRTGRGVEGFSMGGYGAGHLGFKFPQLFGAVSNLAGAVIDVDFFATYQNGRILNHVFSGDREAFHRNHPFTLAENNADAIRGKTFIRIVVGDQDTGRGTLDANRKFHQLLDQLQIQHGYTEVPGVRHSYRALYDALGDEAFEFFAKAFGTIARRQRREVEARSQQECLNSLRTEIYTKK